MSAHEDLRNEIMAAIKKFESATNHEFVAATVELLDATRLCDDGISLIKSLRIETKALGVWSK